MKRISEAQARLILEVSAEARSNYPPAALEKDLHLTAILYSIKNSNFHDMKLVFGGGTSLVKAYRLFDRMSEDLDFKVHRLGLDFRSKVRRDLANLRNQILELMTSIGYQVSNIVSKNDNRYLLFELKYENHFDSIVSLRPYIKLEFFQSQLATPSTLKQVNSLLDLAIDSSSHDFEISCVDIHQTAAEKILGFLNRFYADDHRRDERLIRHIHDLHYLNETSQNPKLIADLFPIILNEELSRYRNRPSLLSSDPISYLTDKLLLFETDESLTRIYEEFVSELTIGSGVEIEVAKANFSFLARSCIQRLASTNQ
jgi:predicted nucleotidyltransferase component of viral defense system